MADSPFAVPVALQVYDSYAVDPRYQKYYTYAWLAFTAVFIAASLPRSLRSVQTGQILKGWAIQERTSNPVYAPAPRGSSEKGAHARDSPTRRPDTEVQIAHQTRTDSTGQGILIRSLRYSHAGLQTIFHRHIKMPKPRSNATRRGPVDSSLETSSAKGFFALTVAQMTLLAGYFALVMICIFKKSELKSNANRPGFLALAMLTPLFLLATKNSPLSILIGSSYTSLNWAHRWVGRLLWLTASIHGFSWIAFYARSDSAATNLGSAKVLRGIAGWVLLTVLAGTSVRPVRRRWYQLFWYTHVLAFVGFFAAVSYHTPYSRPWVYPPIALYAFDIFCRMLKYRFKDAFLVALDDGLTMIHIPDCHTGWLPTQHVKIRILAKETMFESHPLTITSAGPGNGITLFAKVVGDWSRRINVLAQTEDNDGADESEKIMSAGRIDPVEKPCVPVQIFIDGPYGGLKLDLADYQDVLIIAGGSGITFALGCIEEGSTRQRDLPREGRFERVKVVWAVNNLAIVESLASIILDLHRRASETSFAHFDFTIHLTGSTTVDAVLPTTLFAFTTLALGRPAIKQTVQDLLPVDGSEEGGRVSVEKKVRRETGGLAVIACGPEGLVQESRNAVASLSLHDKMKMGSVEFHGECYAI